MGFELNWAPLSPFSFSSCSTLLLLCFALLSSCYAFLHVTILLFMLLFFSSHCYFPLHPNALLFMLMLFSPCYSPLHVVALLFTLMFSSLHCLAFLFALLLSFLVILLFQVEGQLQCCSPFLFVLLLLCCYSLKNLVLPFYIPSCRNWKWLGVENQKPIFF